MAKHADAKAEFKDLMMRLLVDSRLTIDLESIQLVMVGESI